MRRMRSLISDGRHRTHPTKTNTNTNANANTRTRTHARTRSTRSLLTLSSCTRTIIYITTILQMLELVTIIPISIPTIPIPIPIISIPTTLLPVVNARKSIPSTRHSYLYPTTTQWNPSPNIDEEGFLKQSYRRIVGDWETEANIGGRYGLKSNQSRELENIPVIIRQVPGDGNCLFHSLSVGLNFVENRKHLQMKNEMSSYYDDEDSGGNGNGSGSGSGIGNDQYNEEDKVLLHACSTFLRQIAVDMLAPVHDDDEDETNDTNNSNSNNNQNTKKHPSHQISTKKTRITNYKNYHGIQQRIKRRRKRHQHKPLFLQGNEYLHTDDLLHVAASQYDLTGKEYCDLMRKVGVWGGGPEIVAISNYLRRPIHVYELVNVRPHRSVLTSKSNSKSTLSSSNVKKWNRKSLDRKKNEQNDNQGKNGRSGSGKKRKNKKYNNDDDDDDQDKHDKKGIKSQVSKLCKGSQPEFRLRRMACFGSPKYDYKEPLHILSADCRFPDLKPGQEAPNGNHFLAMFPMKKGNMHKSYSEWSSTKRKGFKVRSGASTTDTKRRERLERERRLRAHNHKINKSKSANPDPNKGRKQWKPRFKLVRERIKGQETRTSTRNHHHAGSRTRNKDGNIAAGENPFNVFHCWLRKRRPYASLIDQCMKFVSLPGLSQN